MISADELDGLRETVAILSDPELAKSLQVAFSGLRSARRGHYRVIYAVRDEDADEDTEGTVEIYRVVHRRDA